MTSSSPEHSGCRLWIPLVTILIVASVLLSGCIPGMAGSPGTTSCLERVDVEPVPVTGVFIQPDDGYAPVIDEFAAAQCTIDLNIYMLTDDTVFDALIGARERGVAVRVILEQHPFGMFGDQQEAYERLEDGGVDVRWAPDVFRFSHAKYFVVDEKVAVIMNQNLTGAAFNSNREFGVVTTEPDDVAQLAAIFEADWVGSPDDAPGGSLVVSPDNARDEVVRLIGRAVTSIDVYAELFRDDEVMAAIEAAVARGVRVRLIMNASLDPEDVESVTHLAASGVEVRLTRAIYIHSKVLIVDGEQALVGSINYSMTSLDLNREVAILIDDPALVARIVPIFERDWTRAVPPENVI